VTSRTAALRYARALFDVAIKEGADVSALDAELGSFAALVRGHDDLSKALLNPAVPTARKRAVVAELTSRAAMKPILAKLLGMLAERDRLILLPDLVTAFRQRVEEHQKVIRASLVTAAPLGADREAHIRQTLSQATGRQVTLTAEVNPEIIGGMIARVGSTVFDASLSTQLQKLRQRLTD
jgi:F-type H+-transporting ATPase subunit delta